MQEREKINGQKCRMSRLDEVQDEEKHSEKQEERLIDTGRQQDNRIGEAYQLEYLIRLKLLAL